MPLHIFTSGTHTARDGQTLAFSAEDLAATAARYDPAKHEAPLVVGHPELNAPAYGWVKTLTVTDAGLFAEPDQVHPDFADWVREGRYKKISAAFFLPSAPNNPAPGAYYLRHVGFLGAAAPALKGLAPPTFAGGDDEGVITVEFAQPEDPPPMPEPAEFAQREAALAQREAAIAQREAELAAERQAQRRALDVAFADALVQQGRLLPRDQPGLVEVLSALHEAAPVQFAEAGHVVQKTPRQWLDAFLAHLPVQVDFSERAPAANAPERTPDAEFAASAELQAEFGDVDLYKAWLAAESSGRVLLQKGRP